MEFLIMHNVTDFLDAYQLAVKSASGHVFVFTLRSFC